MLCCASQHKPFIVSFCRYASDLTRQSICETNCESGVRLHGEASDGAFVERSVVVAVAAGNFNRRVSCVPWSPTRSQHGLQGKASGIGKRLSSSLFYLTMTGLTDLLDLDLSKLRAKLVSLSRLH